MSRSNYSSSPKHRQDLFVGCNLDMVKMKTYIISILVALTFVASCSKKKNKKFIHQFDRTKILGRKHKFFYSVHNLILTPNNKLFFHCKDSVLNCCDTGEDYNYPNYIGLNPVDLVAINKQDLIRQIQIASSQKKEDKYSVQIALYSDTIRGSEFEKILLLMDSLRFDNFDIRLITEEEKVVIDHKENNRSYNFYKINWKSRFSYMLFPPPPIDSSE